MTMASNHDLERLRQRSIADRREEPAFFRALLDSTVYAHVPISDDSGRLRFVQFARPDNGQLVLPFFINEAEAYATAGPTRRVVTLLGRVLLEHTLGATLILEPNHGWCVLYPEEIKELLTTGFVARLDVEVTEEGKELLLEPLESVPNWFESTWSALLPRLPYVDNAYLLISAPPQDPSARSLLIVFGVPPDLAERAGRAVATALQARPDGLRMPIDMLTFDPSQGRPELLKGVDIEPIYVRR